jgi:hypothetical protein
MRELAVSIVAEDPVTEPSAARRLLCSNKRLQNWAIQQRGEFFLSGY